jgi:hypothetical protein
MKMRAPPIRGARPGVRADFAAAIIDFVTSCPLAQRTIPRACPGMPFFQSGRIITYAAERRNPLCGTQRGRLPKRFNPTGTPPQSAAPFAAARLYAARPAGIRRIFPMAHSCGFAYFKYST